MKKIVAFITAIAVAICTGIICAFAEDELMLAVEAVISEDGKTVTADVRISNNPGIAAYNIKLEFDNSKLIPTAFREGNITKGITSNFNDDNIDINSVEYVSALWLDMALKTVDDDGVLFTVEFDVKDGASGETELTLREFGEGDIANLNDNDVIMPAVSPAVITLSDLPQEDDPSGGGSEDDVISAYSVEYSEGNAVVAAPESGTVCLIAASFNNDVLQDVIILNIGFSSSGKQTVQLDALNKQNADSVKLLLWKSVDETKSLCPCANKKL